MTTADIVDEDPAATLAHIRAEGAKALEEATAALVAAESRIAELEARPTLAPATYVQRDVKAHAQIDRMAAQIETLKSVLEEKPRTAHRAEKERADRAEQMVCDLRDVLHGHRKCGCGHPVCARCDDDRHVAAALSLTEPVVGRWVSMEEHERVMSVANDCFRLAAERDAAIARAEKAERLERFSVEVGAQAEKARDEVGIQYAAAQAEIARMRPLEAKAREMRDLDSDMLPPRVRRLLGELRDLSRAFDTVPGDALAPKDGVIRVGDHVGYMGAPVGHHHCGYVETLNDTEAGRIDFKPLCRVRRDRHHEGMGPFFWSTADSLTPPTSPAGVSGQSSGSTPAASSVTASSSEVEGSRCGQSGTPFDEALPPVTGLRAIAVAHLEALGVDTSNVKEKA